VRAVANVLTGLGALSHLGFLGLEMSFWDHPVGRKIFFLGCAVVAGVFGGMTAKTSILFTQALPAAIALGLVLLVSNRGASR